MGKIVINKEEIDAINNPEQYRSNGFNSTPAPNPTYGPLSTENKKHLDLMKIGKTSRSCPICLVSFQPNEIAFRLPCKHLFHKSCLDPWLQKNRTCACCRLDLEKHFKESQQTIKDKPTKQRTLSSNKPSNPPTEVYISNLHGLNTASQPSKPQASSNIPKKPNPSVKTSSNLQPDVKPPRIQQSKPNHTRTASASFATNQVNEQRQRADPTESDGQYPVAQNIWKPVEIPLLGQPNSSQSVPEKTKQPQFEAPFGRNPYL